MSAPATSATVRLDVPRELAAKVGDLAREFDLRPEAVLRVAIARGLPAARFEAQRTARRRQQERDR
ncbi:MAG: hypothetical protein F4X35_03085 [Alphaproteobacteria bacterium]|nr:hypothetical protein [Alphaproteobacteria bacterium]